MYIFTWCFTQPIKTSNSGTSIFFYILGRLPHTAVDSLSFTRLNGLNSRFFKSNQNRCTDHVTPLYPQKLALTSPTGGGRSVGRVRSRTKATEFSLISNFSPISNSGHNDRFAMHYFSALKDCSMDLI
jgi:hypothetical protein